MSEDSKKVNVTLVFKMGRKEEPESYWPANLTLIPGNIMECLILEAIFTYMDAKQVTRISQSGFSKGESCFTNLIAFHDGTITGETRGKQWLLSTSTSGRL